METVTIALCAKGIKWHDQAIYTEDGWNLQPANDFLGIKGRVLSKRIHAKPDWLDISDEEAADIGIVNVTALGFWILEMNARTVVACFGGSEVYLNQEKLAASFLPYRIEVQNGKLKSVVLEYMKTAVTTSIKKTEKKECLFCGKEVHGDECFNCGTSQAGAYLEQIMEGGTCDTCGAWKRTCSCD